jgi:hypothetical protein
MIVELFGPPGVGKTTFAHALGAQLQAGGLPVDFLLSHRPAEASDDRPRDARHPAGATGDVLRRLSRPAIEFLGAACRQVGVSSAAAPAGRLLALLPPRDVMWAIRLRQYLVRLERAWQRAAAADRIVLCDQGFLQAIASLIVLGPDRSAAVAAGAQAGIETTADGSVQGGVPAAAAADVLTPALALVPAADMLVRLDAPTHVLATRLARRRCGQGRLERLLELDVAENLAFVAVIGRLDAALASLGRPPRLVGCGDRAALEDGADRIAREIGDAWPVCRTTAA